MPRKGARDLAKEQYWRGVICDWQSGENSVAVFCRLHGHQYNQFQKWRKVIRQRDVEIATAHRKASLRTGTGLSAQSTKQSHPQFVPATIKDSLAAKPASLNESKVEIVLPCGVVLRITSECRTDFLTSLVTALEERAC